MQSPPPKKTRISERFTVGFHLWSSQKLRLSNLTENHCSAGVLQCKHRCDYSRRSKKQSSTIICSGCKNVTMMDGMKADDPHKCMDVPKEQGNADSCWRLPHAERA